MGRGGVVACAALADDVVRQVGDSWRIDDTRAPEGAFDMVKEPGHLLPEAQGGRDAGSVRRAAYPRGLLQPGGPAAAEQDPGDPRVPPRERRVEDSASPCRSDRRLRRIARGVTSQPMKPFLRTRPQIGLNLADFGSICGLVRRNVGSSRLTRTILRSLRSQDRDAASPRMIPTYH